MGFGEHAAVDSPRHHLPIIPSIDLIQKLPARNISLVLEEEWLVEHGLVVSVGSRFFW